MPHLRTYLSLITFVALPNVIGWFRPTSPDAEVVSTLPLRYNDSVWYMPQFVFCKIFSIAHIRHSLYCVHLPKYHWVVSFNRPWTPTRSKAPQWFNTPLQSRIDMSQPTSFYIFNKNLLRPKGSGLNHCPDWFYQQYFNYCWPTAH